MMFEKEVMNKTNISSTSKVKGDISSQEDIIIEGEISGKILTSKKLEIKKSAKAVVDLTADNIIIAGKVEGNIQAQKLEITETGKVFGNINTRIISIAAGAVLNVECKMGEEKKEEIKEMGKDYFKEVGEKVEA